MRREFHPFATSRPAFPWAQLLLLSDILRREPHLALLLNRDTWSYPVGSVAPINSEPITRSPFNLIVNMDKWSYKNLRQNDQLFLLTQSLRRQPHLMLLFNWENWFYGNPVQEVSKIREIAKRHGSDNESGK
ncbi:hypothetical protein Tco_1366605 [Tanacetum coccineum]